MGSILETPTEVTEICKFHVAPKNKCYNKLLEQVAHHCKNKFLQIFVAADSMWQLFESFSIKWVIETHEMLIQVEMLGIQLSK